MIRWYIKKQRIKFCNILLPFRDIKMAKVRRERRLDIMVAIHFLSGFRKNIKCKEREAIFVEGYGFVLLKDYLIILEHG